MSRDYAAIMKSTETADSATVQNEVISLPPGYIVGFDILLRQDYTILIKAGAANVGGSLVQTSTDHQVEEADWVAPKINSTRHYYIYISKDGSFKIDIVAPVWNNDLLYYEQPDMNWRAIGKLFLADSQIVYAVKQIELSGSVVTVAASGFTGESDYYCTGDSDEILIKAGIQYVYNCYGGGTVLLLNGNYFVNDYEGIKIVYSNISLAGSGAGTIIRGFKTTIGNYSSIIKATGYDGSHTINNVRISNLCVDMQDSTSPTSIHIGIWIRYSDKSSVSNCYVINARKYPIYISNCDHSEATGNFVDGNLATLTGMVWGIIDVDGQYNSVSHNKITGFRTDDNFHGIWVSSDYSAVESNRITDISSSGGITFGIRSGMNYGFISDNIISVVKNTGTTTNAYGIYINPNNTLNNNISSNYCYNNGADAGIANTNHNNFYDVGTDTQVYSNSWQMPVAGQPSLGTSHPRGGDPAAWDVDGISSTSYSMASPYTWDLSGVLPVGARAVDITLYIYANTTADISGAELNCWQYELGTSPGGLKVAGPKGVVARVSKMVASDFTYDYVFAQNDGKILLGPSRKLYVGFTFNTGHTGYAMWKFYDC